MSLDHWQEKIYDAFNLLDDFRSDTPNQNPIFALEHGLSASELDCLKADIRTHIANYEPYDRHWLPWVVYATEIGYTYDGQEYWQTFESNTSGWTRLRDRNRFWIRECFIEFQKKFNVAKPSGPWAEHFTNICWPIRHAILPHYLQHQLAKALFDLHLSFRSEHFQSPSVLGNFISTHCRTGTKRFRELLEDSALVGQFCMALLLHNNKISEELLLKETQIRIVADLSKEQKERSWLESAQMQAMVKYKGLHQNKVIGRGYGNREIPDRIEEEPFRIDTKPKIFLYPMVKGEGYAVKLELQDLRSFAECFRNYEPFIANNFCTINGTTGSPLPKGMFLRPGPHPVYPLNRWPSSNETLIKYEDAPPELHSLLSMNNFIPAGEIHLFKISMDNIGYEIYEKNLRPNQKYVIVSMSPIERDGMVFKPFNLECEGVYSALVETPNEFTSDFENLVKKHGLRCVKSLRVWPVGIPTKDWDDEGYAVWLAGDHIRFAIQADYELERIEVTINDDDDPYLIDTPESNCEPILFDIPFLPPGNNQIEIKAIPKYKSQNENIVGYLTAIVIEPQVQDAKTLNQGSLKGFVYPENPSMEEIWTNDISIEIYGPVGQDIECKVRYLDSKTNAVIREKRISGLKLPILSEQWRKNFAALINRDESMQEAYDEAHSCELFFYAEEKGYFTISGERKFTPIRWAIHKSGNHMKLRYINDTEIVNFKILRYEFATPDLFEDIDKVENDQTVECEKGGLFLIQGDDEINDSIIMMPYLRKITLDNMMILPKLCKSYNWGNIRQLIILYNYWERARVYGTLSDLWRKQVLKIILSTLCQIIGGKDWEIAEIKYLAKSDSDSLTKLKQCISEKSSDLSIGSIIERDIKNIASKEILERKDYFENLFSKQIKNLVEIHHTDFRINRKTIIRKAPARLLPEFILRLSSVPNTLLAWNEEKYEQLIKYLKDNPMIFRAGRYMVLAVENQYASEFGLNDLYSGWKWS